MATELERKFLIREIPPEIQKIRGEKIRQGYISRDRDKEVRLRQKGSRYYLTVKSNENLKRNEYETSISREQFETLWPATEGCRLEKERKKIKLKEYVLEIDIYSGDPLEGLIVGEVEFPNLRRAQKFQIPDFFREEITFDKRFKNYNLAGLASREKNIFKSEIEGDFKLIGAIPYRKKKGHFEILSITTRSGMTWIYPKGQPIKGKTSEDVAYEEAWEEGGIKGSITGHPLVVPYNKRGEDVSILLYPLEIEKVYKEFDEKGERDRKFISLHEAPQVIGQPGLVSALEFFYFKPSLLLKS